MEFLSSPPRNNFYQLISDVMNKWKLQTIAPLISFMAILVLSGCGGGEDDSQTVSTKPSSVSCEIDSSVQPSYEEQRLTNKLVNDDATSFADQILLKSGFDAYTKDFSQTLCNNGKTAITDYSDAVTTMQSSGEKLWKAAVDRVQGRAVNGSLPQSDDRMLYWARLTMTKALRQWKPEYTLTDEQKKTLQESFEKASRGQTLIDFPAGPAYKRILVSGFDPFTLGEAGKNGQLQIRIGNPAGATVLSLDGNTLKLPDGSTAVIKTFILPVNYAPFIAGMQEDVLGPWFKAGSKRIDASITMSQGSYQFNLEHYNGRYQLASAPGNDNLYPDCATGGKFPAALDCDIMPPSRWLGYDAKPWQRDSPPQFTESTLPFDQLIAANTGKDVINRDTNQLGGWPVILHDTYTVEPCTKAASDANAARSTAEALAQKYQKEVADPPDGDYSAAEKRYEDTIAALDALPTSNPLETNCATSGGGGSYLSNASGYRNTLLRDVFGLKIPAGHIHTPIMTLFGPNSDRLITDAVFEARRDSIVEQARNLVFATAKTLSSAPKTQAPQ